MVATVDPLLVFFPSSVHAIAAVRRGEPIERDVGLCHRAATNLPDNPRIIDNELAARPAHRQIDRMVRFPRAVLAFCLITLLAGCGTAAGAEQSFGDGELVNNIAAQLSGADSVAYTAVFSLENNTTVSIAHGIDPARTEYRFTGGLVLITPTGVTTCTTTGAAVCRRTTAASPGAGLPPRLDSVIQAGGLIRPETVIALLTQTSLNADALISEQDSTIAGDNATCVSISGVPEPDSYTACVTASGLLGSFSGTAGTAIIDIELASFTMSVAPDAFDLPPGAKTSS
jgi:hypothetical protein